MYLKTIKIVLSSVFQCLTVLKIERIEIVYDTLDCNVPHICIQVYICVLLPKCKQIVASWITVDMKKLTTRKLDM